MKNLIKLIKKSVYHISSRLLPTKIYLKLLYRYNFDKKLNLKNPQTLNEKLQWKKVYDKKEIYQICSDKYAVRNYVKIR